ncbi:MAG TPA: carboxypeptidase-like regulatory domain-containing protein [Thermoanaerobaculia bacterium]|nr:carboxypeptidase-like regulatory domain-containing protein [Thermoanaerobaculia bacterium]
MATRSERLNRLAVGSACGESWEGMLGEGCRRHCAACRRDVLDLAQLSPREIASHLQASRGKMCGRVTRRGERLVMAPVVEPLSFAAAGPRRRAPALAATLVGAWLVASSAGAETEAAPPAAVADGRDAADRSPLPHPEAAAAAGAGATALHGRVQDPSSAPLPGVLVVVRNTLAGTAYEALTHADGSFAFDDVPVGTYDLEATFDGFDMEVNGRIVLRPGVRVDVEVIATPPSEMVTTGVLIPTAEPLRQLFADSDLAVVAIAGPSSLIERDGDVRHVSTELRIETVVKGPAELRRIRYRHDEYAEEGGGEVDVAGKLVPGTRVLAFLDRSEGETSERGMPVYEAVDYQSVKLLGEAEVDAYLRRLAALQRVETRAARRAEGDPEELLEWLVATAEEPLTRGEATEELARALDALDEQADRSSLTPAQAAADLLDVVDRFHDEGGRLQAEPQPELLGAFIGEAQRERLAAALVATVGLREGDRALFELVRRWDEVTAMAWLAAHVDAPVRDDDAGELHYWLQSLVDDIGDARLQAIVDEVSAREEAVNALWSEDETAETQALREEKLRVLWADLRRELAVALAVPR